MDLKKTNKEKTSIKRKRRLKFGIKQKLLIYFLLVSIIPIVGITIYSTLSLNQSYESDRLDSLDAIGDNKMTAMVDWFSQRRNDVDFMTETQAVREWGEIAATPDNVQQAYGQNELEKTFTAMIKAYGSYNEMFFLDIIGTIVTQLSP